MKTKITSTLFSVTLLLSVQLSGQHNNPPYDSTLAASFGGDAYGMKGYFLVLLKTGVRTDVPKDSVSLYFRGHLANIEKLASEKKLIVAGPLQKNKDQLRGIFILNTSSQEEAKAWLEKDPAVNAGLLAADMYKWYGSAALPAYLEEVEKIWKQRP